VRLSPEGAPPGLSVEFRPPGGRGPERAEPEGGGLPCGGCLRPAGLWALGGAAEPAAAHAGGGRGGAGELPGHPGGGLLACAGREL